MNLLYYANLVKYVNICKDEEYTEVVTVSIDV